MSHRVVLRVTAVCCCLFSALNIAAPAAPGRDPLEPARAALRTLQFNTAMNLLRAGANASNPGAQYLLGLMYLSGVGTPVDVAQAKALLQSAAEHGDGAAAFALAGQLAQEPDQPPDAVHHWLERSAQLGYPLGIDALKSGRPLLAREWTGQSDPALLAGWALDRARRNDATELRRLGPPAAQVRDEFGRGALSYAAGAGADAAASALLDLGADVEAVDKTGTTALMIAAGRPDAVMLDLLLHHHAHTATRDAVGRTAVFYAAQANRPESIRTLKEAGAELDAADERGYDALDEALSVAAAAAAGQLRDFGVRAKAVTAGPATPAGRFDAEHPGDLYRGWPPLGLAVARNDTPEVKTRLEGGADANQAMPHGESLLQVAADVHALDTLSVLLAHRADATLAGRDGHTALWLAAVRGDVPVLKALLSGGVAADTHAAAESTPLVAALGGSHPEVALLLLAAGASPDATDAQRRTALMFAAARGDAQLVRVLLDHHARTDAVDAAQRTALWYAAAIGSKGSVALLLAAGSSAESTDESGLSALHAAAGQAHEEVLEPLLAADARINRRSNGGDTPLLVAAAAGHVEVVRTLLARSPELDLQNKGGDTALIVASRDGNAQICRLLVAAGAKRSLRNAAGVSAQDVARRRGFVTLAAELAD